MNTIAFIIAIISFFLCVYASAFMSTRGENKIRKKGLLISLISIVILALSGSYLLYL